MRPSPTASPTESPTESPTRSRTVVCGSQWGTLFGILWGIRAGNPARTAPFWARERDARGVTGEPSWFPTPLSLQLERGVGNHSGPNECECWLPWPRRGKEQGCQNSGGCEEKERREEERKRRSENMPLGIARGVRR